MTELINPVLCALITARIFSYQRKGSEYRLRHSLTAYLIAASVGGIGLATVVAHDLVEPLQTVLLSVLCMSLFAVRGNVAELFRVSE